MSRLALRFPEVYAGGKVPAAFGFRDLERKCITPVYMYGWLVPRAELYETLYGEPAALKILLSELYEAAEQLLDVGWRQRGYVYLDSEYNPAVPAVEQHNSKYLLIYMACNDSDAIIKSIMENEKYHEDARACLKYPKAMKSEPAWIRFGMRHVPEELSGNFADRKVE